ncbi:hypothetical protein SSABA_v1c05890 [Spiroplasma sabaudiense Ar-1343]|uniref:Colicin V production protein n=1 Tax=Spiroplasma sabaudiense Ar-1343 TaxID=1276257 RepID=W6A9Y8_9MOLU|nr:hypothetical protein [Spiroplasma sabaudiense]AHI53993.1 hypothetical protein SSABA_v1c05890 [Spiroplasma sabaudiense Ar-1343]
MLINIGPWWLYDLLIFTVLIAFTIWGMKRGAWVMVYFGGVNIFAAILIIFLVPVITSATVSLILPIFNLDFLKDLISSFNEVIQSTFAKILGIFGSSTEGLIINTDALTESFLTSVIAVVLNFFYQATFLITINLIAIILYFTFLKKRLISIKINSHVNILLGTTFGLIMGLFAAFGIFSFASNPLFKTESHRIVDQNINTSDLNFENFKKVVENGNSYMRRAPSSYAYRFLPKYGFYYNTECISKFVVIPMLTIYEFSQNNPETATNEAIDFINNLYVDNYSTNNYFKTDVINCSLSMPPQSQNLFRVVTEGSFAAAALADSLSKIETSDSLKDNETTQFNFSYGSFTDLKLQLETFMQQHQLTQMGRRDFSRFYKENPTATDNEFIKVADLIAADNVASGRTNHVVDVLKSGEKTYTFFKNIYLVNQLNQEFGTASFLPAFYSSLGLIAGLELVSTSNVINPFTGIDYHHQIKYNFSDWAKIVDYA